MNERRTAEIPGDPAALPASVTQSGVVRISRADRPSWERVDEYLLSGQHREQVEAYARKDPAFADVLRWMRNERDEIDAEAPPSHDGAEGDLEPWAPAEPSRSNLRHLPGCQTTGVRRVE